MQNYFSQSLNGQLDDTLDNFLNEFFEEDPFDSTQQTRGKEAEETESTVASLFVSEQNTYGIEDEENVDSSRCRYFLGEHWDPKYLNRIRQGIGKGLEKGIEVFQRKFENKRAYNLGTLASFKGLNTALHHELAGVFDEMKVEGFRSLWYIQEVCDRFAEYLIEQQKNYKKEQPAPKQTEQEQKKTAPAKEFSPTA